MLIRPRRNRKSSAIRKLIAETILQPSDLIAPFFLIEGSKASHDIPHFFGIQRLSVDRIIAEATVFHQKGVQALALFPSLNSSEKDKTGSFALKQDSFLIQAIEKIKQELPDMALITDIALDPFTLSGHDGILDEQGHIDNDATVEKLCQMALVHAQAGADIVAPSDMMDGRIRAIRERLDHAKYINTSIMSYAAKYASSLYTPFRHAVTVQKTTLDKKTYQLNPANRQEALQEVLLDAQEGADMLLVKPASLYLDVILAIKEKTFLPLGAYHVSGEYALVKAAAQAGAVDEVQVFLETLLSIKRAGADFIFTYALKEILPSFD